MSQAFVKENDEQWLHEIAPTVAALVNYLVVKQRRAKTQRVESAA